MKLDEISEDALKAIIAGGVEIGVRKALVALGIDIDDADSLVEWHARQAYLKRAMDGAGIERAHARQLWIVTAASTIAGTIAGVFGSFLAHLFGAHH